jgi:hypothetical protein
VISRKLRWTGHGFIQQRKEMQTRFYCGNLFENSRLEDRKEHGRIILKWIYGKYVVRI